MRTVLPIYKAAPIGEQRVPDLTITCACEIPEVGGTGWEYRASALYNGEGKALEAALLATLPGGTYDALLRAMLERRASFFRVPFESPKPQAAPEIPPAPPNRDIELGSPRSSIPPAPSWPR